MSDSQGPALPAALARLHRLGGEALVSRLVELFAENTPRRLQTVAEGCRNGDLNEARRALHSLRSTAGNLGAEELATAAGALELLAERGAAAAVLEGLPRLHSLCQSTSNYLESHNRRSS